MWANPGFRCLPPMTAILVALTAAERVMAHRLDAWVHVIDNEIVVEAYFNDGEAAQNADVTVSDSDGKLLAKGKTDTAGKFTFTPARLPDRIEIVVNTGQGHRCTKTMTRKDLVALNNHPQMSKNEEPRASARLAFRHPTTTTSDAPATPGDDELTEIKQSLTSIQASLRNIRHELAKLNKPRTGVSFDSILAGVGFIFGLTGVAAYCLARRQRPN